MRIIIRDEKTNFSLMLPTALCLNHIAAAIISKIVRSKEPSMDLDIEDFMKVIYVIKKYKQQHKHWVVVDYSSPNGERVYVSL